jgi:hypothetical protein
VPGHSSRWALAPAAAAAAVDRCQRLRLPHNGWSAGGPGGIIGASRAASFIVLTSVPLSALLFWRCGARPIAPLPVALSGAQGVAALAAFLLQFFHPFDVTAIDLALHLAAVGVIALLAVALRRPLLGAS